LLLSIIVRMQNVNLKCNLFIIKWIQNSVVVSKLISFNTLNMQTNKLTYVEMNYKKVQASYHVLLCNLGFYD